MNNPDGLKICRHPGENRGVQVIRASLVGALVFFLFLFAQSARAGQVTLAWDANSEPDLAGYKIYSGTQPGSPTRFADVGNVTTATITDLDDCTAYYHTATAYDRSGNESGYSNEVSYATALPLNMSLSPSQPGIIRVSFQGGCPGGAGYTLDLSDGTTSLPVIDTSDGDTVHESSKVCSGGECVIEAFQLDPTKSYTFTLKSLSETGALAISEQSTISLSQLPQDPQISAFISPSTSPLELVLTTTELAYCHYGISGSGVSLLESFLRTGNSHTATASLPDGRYAVSAVCRNWRDQITSTATLSVEIGVALPAAAFSLTTDGQRLHAVVDYTGAPLTLDLEVNGRIVSRHSSLAASGQITIPIRRLSDIADGTNSISVILDDGIHTIREEKTLGVPLHYQIIGDFEGTPDQEAAQWQAEAGGITKPFAQTEYSTWTPAIFATGEAKNLTEGDKALLLRFNSIPPENRAAITGNASFDPREYSETRLTVYNPNSISVKPLALAISYTDPSTAARYQTPPVHLRKGWNSVSISHDQFLKYPSTARAISEVPLLSDPTVALYNLTGNSLAPGDVHLDKWLVVHPDSIVELSYASTPEALQHWQSTSGAAAANGGAVEALLSGMAVTSDLSANWRGCIMTADILVPDLSDIIELQFRGYAATTDQRALVQLKNGTGETVQTSFPLGDSSSAYYPPLIQTAWFTPIGEVPVDLSQVVRITLCNYIGNFVFPETRNATFTGFSVRDLFPPRILH